jgi:UDP-glucose 4-epimerase
MGTLNALLAAKEASVDGFVFASSIAPLGDITPPAHEGLIPRPKSPYGASKLAGEGYCSAFAGSYGVPTVVLRFSNVYGPYSYHKGSVVASFCREALRGQPIVIHGDGSQTRDFVYVGDLCAGIVGAMTSGAAGVVAHLGSGVATSVVEVAQLVAARVGGDVRVERHPARPGDVQHSSADIRRAASLFGFTPSTGLPEGIDQTVSWFEHKVG